ncbi:hypothetical protein [Haloarchaeobius sp. DT45]|uniref:hypothetical protein n=1 Tax=Haloarchaeobius sp. DT45 TaxID=3446116 RepID=UPI003F6C3C67
MTRAQSVRQVKVALGVVVVLFAAVVVATLGLGMTLGTLTRQNTMVASLGLLITLMGLLYVVYAEAFAVWLGVLLSGETDYDAVEVDPDDVKQRKRGGLLMVVGGLLAIAISLF